jgi:hypothetical protein
MYSTPSDKPSQRAGSHDVKCNDPYCPECRSLAVSNLIDRIANLMLTDEEAEEFWKAGLNAITQTRVKAPAVLGTQAKAQPKAPRPWFKDNPMWRNG